MTERFVTARGPITIRPAIPEEAARLRALRLEALTDRPDVFAADYASTEKETIEFWAERIASYAEQNQGLICVASTESGLIGMTGLVCGHWPKTRHSGSIWGVYVKADWRGFHVAEAMLRECIAWAQAQGLVIVKLGVITTNTAAIRCYARCGFTVYGIDPKAIFYNQVYYDELLMAKQI